MSKDWYWKILSIDRKNPRLDFMNINHLKLWFFFQSHEVDFLIEETITIWDRVHSALEGSNLPQKSVSSLWYKKVVFAYIFTESEPWY